jgi:type IV pilus assembly protein PilA
MVQKLRERSQGEGGFTLVELLVVMLILGLLAAIAIPSFFNQRDKARDADAKSSVRTAQTAVETYATDNGGSYTGVAADADGNAPYDAGSLEAIENTLGDAPGALTVTGSGNTYEVQVVSTTGNAFRIARSAGGTTTLSCGNGGEAVGTALTGAGTDGCPSGGNWG